MKQKHTSAATSINSKRVPAVFSAVKTWKPGTRNIDYGGGRYDTATEYLAGHGVENLIYDPYNRSRAHNMDVLRKACGGCESGTLSNVLNVIAERNVRRDVLRTVASLVLPGHHVYITVYEGDGSGHGRVTKSGYQLNRKTADYLPEIQAVFRHVERHGRVIIATV